MAQPNTPKSSTEKPSQAPNAVQPFVQYADNVSKMLSFDKKEWEGLMRKVNEVIPRPDDERYKDAFKAARVELNIRYRDLSEDRLSVAKQMNALVAFAFANKPVDPVLQANAMRSLGSFVEDLDVYEHRLTREPLRTSLPKFLSKYVSTRESEELAVRMTGYMLPLQYDVRDKAALKESPQRIAPLAKEIAMGAVRLKVRMSSVDECAPNGVLATDDAPYERFLALSGFALEKDGKFDPETIDATKFLVQYIMKFRGDIKKYDDIRMKGATDELTVAQALECAAQSSAMGDLVRQIAMNAKESITAQVPDIRSFVKDIFEKGDFMPEKMLQVALAPLANLDPKNEADRKRFEEDVKVVIPFFRSEQAKNYSAKNLTSYIENFTEPQKRMILGVANRVTSPENAPKTIDRMMHAAFLSTDPTKQDGDEKKIAATLQSLIGEGKISARDTFDLFYLLETKGMDLLLAYKLVAILDTNGEPRMAADLQMRLLRDFYDVATSNPEEIEKIAKEFNITPENQVELDNVRQYLAESGVSAVAGLWDKFVLFHKHWGWYAVAVDAYVAKDVIIGTAVIGMRVNRALQVGNMAKFVKMGPEQARAFFKIPPNVSAGDIANAQREAVKILTEYDHLALRFHFFEGRGLALRGNAVVDAVKTGELGKMAIALKGSYPNVNDLASELTQWTSDGDAIRGALNQAGYSAEDVEKGMRSIASTLDGLNSSPVKMQEQITALGRELEKVRADLLKQKMNPLLRELDDILNVADAPTRRDLLDAWNKRAKAFQAEVNAVSETAPGARRLLAEEAVGKSMVTDDVWDTVEKMHAATTLEEKVSILNKANLPPDQQRAIKKLARIGIAGESDDAARAVDVVEDLPAAAREFLRNVDDAEKTGSSLAKLAAEAPVDVLDDAARAGGKAATLSRAAKAGRASEFVGKGALTLEVFIGVYMLYENRQRIAAAEKEGDTETARILKDRERSLSLASSGGVLSLALKPLALSGPAAVALAGGTWYADTLYDHAIDLNKSTHDDYKKETSGTLLYNAERLRGVHSTDAVTDGPETRDIRRALMLEAFLRKRAKTSAGVRAGMAVLDYLTKSSSEGEFDIKGAADVAKTTPVVLMETACDVAALYDARETLAAQKLPLSFTYNGNVVDLSLLPRVVEDQRTVFTDVAIAGVSVIARQYKAYQLEQQRAAYVAIGEIRSKMTGSDQGWSEAADIIRPMLLQRLSPSIAVAEGRVTHYFTGFIPELQTAAAMLELRRTVLEMSTSLQSAMLNPENSSEQIAAIEKRIARNLEAIDPQKLYDNADSTQGSLRFNPVKHGIVTMNTSFGGPLDPVSNLHWRTGGIRDVQKVIEKQLGTPLDRCVSALID